MKHVSKISQLAINFLVVCKTLLLRLFSKSHLAIQCGREQYNLLLISKYLKLFSCFVLSGALEQLDFCREFMSFSCSMLSKWSSLFLLPLFLFSVFSLCCCCICGRRFCRFCCRFCCYRCCFHSRYYRGFFYWWNCSPLWVVVQDLVLCAFLCVVGVLRRGYDGCIENNILYLCSWEQVWLSKWINFICA